LSHSPLPPPDGLRETLQLKVAMQVMLTARRWTSWVAEEFRDAGHTGAPTRVLYYLADRPKGLTLSELSSRMELSGPSLTRLVQRLERDGMVSRRRMVGDLRSWLIVMEPPGRAEFEAFEVHAAAMRQRVFAGVSDKDMAAALRVLDAVACRLGEGSDPAPAANGRV
jgi:MarR family transcriptional regulator for hemolysin